MKIPVALYEDMIAHAKAGAPLEACGLVGGVRESGDAAKEGGSVATRFRATPNEARSETFYTIPPLEILKFQRELDGSEQDLVAVFHSHPATRAYPSETDIRLAFYPDAVYLILSLAVDPPDLRGYRIQDGTVTEVQISVER